MFRMRILPVLGAAVLLLAPLTSVAADAATLAERRQANIKNDLARCALVAQGAKVPGKVAPSQPESAAGCNAGARALQSLPSGPAATCPVSGRTLNKAEINAINNYLTALAKSQKKHTPTPTLSDDVRGLMAC